MADPRYLVTSAPGIVAPRGGFHWPGEAFDAPLDWVPSITLLPLNDEAAYRLDTTFKAREELLQERFADSSGASRGAIAGELVQVQRDHARALVPLTPAQASSLSSDLASAAAYPSRGI